MASPIVAITDELREFVAQKGINAIAVDIIDCSNCCRHLSEVFAYIPSEKQLPQFEKDALQTFDCNGIQVLIISPDLVVGDAVSFSFNGNRHLGNIDVEGIGIR